MTCYVDPYVVTPEPWDDDDLRDCRRAGWLAAQRYALVGRGSAKHKAFLPARTVRDGAEAALWSMSHYYGVVDAVEAAEALLDLRSRTDEDLEANGYANEDRATKGRRWRLQVSVVQ